MADSFVQVNVPSTAGKKLATYEYNKAGDTVESEAVTLTDSAGNEVLPATQSTLAAAAATLIAILSKLPAASSTATTTVVAGTNVAFDLLAADPLRLGFTVFNQSDTDTMYLLFQPAGAASPSSFSVPLQPNTYYEVPFRYYGRVSAVWSAANPLTTMAMLTVYT